METVKRCNVCLLDMAIVNNVNGVEIRFCLSCGFTTTNDLKIGSNEVEQFEAKLPELVRKLKYIDEDLGQIWYPICYFVPCQGAIYPEGTEFNWAWKVAREVIIPVVERMNYPIPGQTGKYYEKRLGVENAKTFKNFREAFEYFNKIETL